VDGYVKTFQSLAQVEGSIMQKIHDKLARVVRHPSVILQFGLYIVCFAMILIVAQINPSKFFIIMEVFASASLNLESGFFIAIMIWQIRKPEYQVDIPLPLPRWVRVVDL